MSINIVQGPLIQPNVNIDNNTTRIMKVSDMYSIIITDGIADIQNGYISNLIEPISGNEIATKFYVDHAGGGGGVSGPVDSIQFNSGTSFAGSSNLTVSNPGTGNEVLNVSGSFTNGTVTLSGNQFNGLINPTTSQEAATKNYVDESLNKLEVITINVFQDVAQLYTPDQVYNNIINLTYNQNNVTGLCPVDLLPTGSDMSAFLGTEFQIGKSWTTIFRMPQIDQVLLVRFIGEVLSEGNLVIPTTYYYCGIALPVFTLVNNSVVTITSVVINATSGSELIYSYVTSNFIDITTNAQITDQGVLTSSFGSGSLLGNGSIIYPMLANPTLNSVSPIIYTYSNLQKIFIIRSGLTSNTSDTFVSATVLVTDDAFLMGSGTFKFFIQNISAHTLTLLPSTGWSFQTGNNGVIPPSYCGAFWVSVTVSPAACLIYSIGTSPINS
jgi:hypothetical protein